MDNPVSGKHIFITGAGRGLGAAFAVVMSDMGAHVTIAGRNPENLYALAESIRLRNGKAPQTTIMDLADISQVTLFAKKCRDEKRPLDILINNAATWLSGPMQSHDALSIANTITANVTGTLLLTRGLLPLLQASKAADIVNMISISGMPNVPLQGASVAYIASKHGQAGMTEALRQELRGQNIRITAIHPPNIEDISPLDAKSWNAERHMTSWLSNRDVVEATLASLSRARHITYASLVLETATSNFHGH
jgi:short-subunit dehydrogenase